MNYTSIMRTHDNSKKNCIFLITRGYKWRHIKAYHSLISRNRAIGKFLRSSESRKLGWTDFEIVIFHEGNIDFLQRLYLVCTSHMKLKFINIKSVFRLGNHHNWTGLSEMPISYSLMCQFQYFHVWKYLAKYDLICRIDEDVTMLTWPAIKKDFKFIAGAVFRETHELTNSTFPILLKKIGLEKFYDNFFPLTNFYVTRSIFILDSHIQNYFKIVYEDANSANNRWGDLPIIGVGLKAFLNWNCYDGIDSNITYLHGSHNGLVRDGEQFTF